MSDPRGGSAFPQHPECLEQGMWLRDYFATHALSGWLAANGEPVSIPPLAKWAYKMADAMLEARK